MKNSSVAAMMPRLLLFTFPATSFKAICFVVFSVIPRIPFQSHRARLSAIERPAIVYGHRESVRRRGVVVVRLLTSKDRSNLKYRSSIIGRATAALAIQERPTIAYSPAVSGRNFLPLWVLPVRDIQAR